MSMPVLLAPAFAWLLGILIVGTLCPPVDGRKDFAVILPLGVIVGYGVTAVIFFVASLMTRQPALVAGLAEAGVIVGLSWKMRRRPVGRDRLGACEGEDLVTAKPAARASLAHWTIAFVFIQAVVVAGVVAWRAYRAEPWGGWDGWTIWNMHARFILRGGTAWPELLQAPELSWTHPDYPPLLPATVARIWSWAGEETPWAAALVSVSFAAAMLALTIAVVSRFRGQSIGLVAGLVLLTTPFFVTFAPNQHADIPLASFMLAAVALVLLASTRPTARGAWSLAGLCAGLAAWTKNEGLLFVGVFSVATGFLLGRRKSPSAALSFLGTLALPLAAVIFFKVALAPGNDLLAVPLAPRWQHVFDWSRHANILSSLGRDLGRFGEWQLAPWLALAAPFAAWRQRRRLPPAEWIVPLVLALMLAGYYGVYLLTPHDLSWHLDSSLVRLLLQLWPLAILTWSLAVPPWRSQSTAADPLPRNSRRVLFGLTSSAIAAIIVSALSLQRAANEFAVRHIGRAEVIAVVGDGWFALERHGRDEWAWSSGHAQLPLRVKGSGVTVPIGLSFGLRSTGTRLITIRQGDHTLWRGEVGGEYTPVTLSGLMLAPGTTVLEFFSDAPAVQESTAAGGRALSFAVYNVRLK